MLRFTNRIWVLAPVSTKPQDPGPRNGVTLHNKFKVLSNRWQVLKWARNFNGRVFQLQSHTNLSAWPFTLHPPVCPQPVLTEIAVSSITGTNQPASANPDISQVPATTTKLVIIWAVYKRFNTLLEDNALVGRWRCHDNTACRHSSVFQDVLALIVLFSQDSKTR